MLLLEYYSSTCGTQYLSGIDLPNNLPREPQEGLFEVIIRFGGNLEVLEVFLPVEGDSRRLYFTLLLWS